MEKSLIEVFSFWILIWFILFYIKIIKYNPLFYIIISYIIIIIVGFLIIYNNDISTYNKFKYFIINNIFKLIPLLLIIEFPIIFYLQDILFGIFLMFIYFITMTCMNKNIIQIYTELYNAFTDDNHKHNRGFMSKLYDDIYSYLFNSYNK
jgi:hypothetical protein